MGKGSARRPCQISREEEDLRWELAMGLITREQFEDSYRQLKIKGPVGRGQRNAKSGK